MTARAENVTHLLLAELRRALSRGTAPGAEHLTDFAAIPLGARGPLPDAAAYEALDALLGDDGYPLGSAPLLLATSPALLDLGPAGHLSVLVLLDRWHLRVDRKRAADGTMDHRLRWAYRGLERLRHLRETPGERAERLRRRSQRRPSRRIDA